MSVQAVTNDDNDDRHHHRHRHRHQHHHHRRHHHHHFKASYHRVIKSHHRLPLFLLHVFAMSVSFTAAPPTEAQSKRGVLTLKYPIEHGIVTNWDDTLLRCWRA